MRIKIGKLSISFDWNGAKCDLKEAKRIVENLRDKMTIDAKNK